MYMYLNHLRGKLIIPTFFCFNIFKYLILLHYFSTCSVEKYLSLLSMRHSLVLIWSCVMNRVDTSANETMRRGLKSEGKDLMP